MHRRVRPLTSEGIILSSHRNSNATRRPDKASSPASECRSAVPEGRTEHASNADHAGIQTTAAHGGGADAAPAGYSRFKTPVVIRDWAGRGAARWILSVLPSLNLKLRRPGNGPAKAADRT